MVVSVSTADPRSIKVLTLLEGADRWQKGHRYPAARGAGGVPWPPPAQARPGLHANRG